LKTVPTWLDADHIDEIVIVDWSSNIPIFEDPLTQNIMSDRRVRVVRVDGERYFLNPAFSINLAIERATHNNILKLDIDYQLINKDFTNYLQKAISKLEDCYFIFDSNFLEDSEDRNNISMTGFVLLNKKHFELVNGYNEIFRGWGYEDLHMYQKLGKVAQPFVINNLHKFIYHLPHTDERRNENHIDKDISIVENERKNRSLSLLPEPERSQYKTKSKIIEKDLIKYEIVERIK
jgi:hypothetical protein